MGEPHAEAGEAGGGPCTASMLGVHVPTPRSTGCSAARSSRPSSVTEAAALAIPTPCTSSVEVVQTHQLVRLALLPAQRALPLLTHQRIGPAKRARAFSATHAAAQRQQNRCPHGVVVVLRRRPRHSAH